MNCFAFWGLALSIILGGGGGGAGLRFVEFRVSMWFRASGFQSFLVLSLQFFSSRGWVVSGTYTMARGRQHRSFDSPIRRKPGRGVRYLKVQATSG